MASNSDEPMDSRPHGPYFCHSCNRQGPEYPQNGICPNCNSDFLEIVDSVNDDVQSQDDGMMFYNNMGQFLESLLTRRRPSRLSPSGENENPDGAGTHHHHPHHHVQIQFRRETTPRGEDEEGGPSGAAADIGNFIEHIMMNLQGGQGGGNRQQFLFMPNSELHGNPGDYAWGRGGLDAIVTQLLNQAESSGPPPLKKEVIDTIPKMKVTQEQIDSNLQCSVCWDNFTLGEEVRCLNCEHIYHESCIVPWLKIHGTCPVCRKFQGNEEELNASCDHSPPPESESTSSSSRRQPTDESLEENGQRPINSSIPSFARLFEFFGPSSSSSSRENQTLPNASNSASSSSNQENNSQEGNRSGRRNNEFSDYDLE